MAEADVGAILIENDGEPYGLLTDRDIVVRGLAKGSDAEDLTVGEIGSTELLVLSPDDELSDAVELMREKKVRRLLVANESGEAVGMASLGDLAVERDPSSVLGQISAAPPTL